MIKKEISSKQLKLTIAQKLLGIFLAVFCVAIIIICYFSFIKVNNDAKQLIIAKDQSIVSELIIEIKNIINTTSTDLQYLENSQTLKNYLKSSRSNSQIELKSKDEIISTYTSFMNAKKYIHKIRYIDINGNEKINLQFDNQLNKIYVIEDKELQNIKNNKYFKEALLKNNKNIYISDLDLNSENIKATFPYLPSIRFSKLIIDENNFKNGVFVLNIYGSYLLNRVKKSAQRLQNIHKNIFMINHEGNYLYNNNKHKLWGKDLGHNKSLVNDNKLLFEKIKAEEQGTFEDKKNLYSFKKIYPSNINMNKYWVVFTKTKKSLALKEVENFNILFGLILLSTVFLALFFINNYLQKLSKHLKEISRQLNIFSTGKIPANILEDHECDEFGEIEKISQLIFSNFRVLLTKLKEISRGDMINLENQTFSNNEFDEIIYKIIQKMKEKDKIKKYEQWVNEGARLLIADIYVKKSIKIFSNDVISLLCRYIGASKAVFFLSDSEHKSLTLIGSFMLSKEEINISKLFFGEGNIGEAAYSKRPLLISNINDKVSTTLTKQSLESSYTFPIIYGDEVYAVIEIMSLKLITNDNINYIRKMQDIISNMLFILLQKQEIEDLLKATKIDQVRLGNQNKEMEEQARVLESNNIQMEEQQQQMEEQQHKLKNQNEQLLEQQTLLENQNVELLESKTNLAQRANDLETANKYKTEFLANMSHELRTPLNSIILLSDMLQENTNKNLNKEEIKKTNIINSCGGELLRLVNDILDLSKIEAGETSCNIENFSSKELSEELNREFLYAIEKKGLKFVIKDKYKKQISSDKNKLSQILKNLLSNSLKFTKEGTITLEINEKNKKVQISVTDTGIGIENDKQKSIFKAFQQADGSISREYGGTGLGLSISNNFINIIKGDITLKSKVNKGSTFSIIFPNLEVKTKTKTENSFIKKSNEIIDDREKLTAMDKVFLIIEDDIDFSLVLKEKINLQNEYVLIANSGKEGLDLIRNYTTKGILLDLNLPDMDGIDVLKELKINTNSRNIPVYVISADQRQKITKEFGAIGYANKPIKSEEIITAINSINSFNEKEVKDLLILEDDKKLRDSLIENIGNETVKSKGVASEYEAIEELKKEIYYAIIIDLNLNNNIGYKICKFINDNKLDIPIIIYTGKVLTNEENEKLKDYTDSTIIKTASSQERLLDEVDIFMHRVKIETKDKKQNIRDIDFQNAKILIADDDIRNIYVLSEILNAKGATVITASNGLQAIELLNDNIDVSIIFMDIMMPIMDGLEATKIIKNDKKLKDIPIIALTAKAMKEDKQIALDEGCDDYLTKPINMDIFINITQGWLNK